MQRELLAPGLWRFEVSHPEWNEKDGGRGGWEPQVAWHLLEAPEATVLIDPLVLDNDAWSWLDERIESRQLPVEIVVTVYWHLRSTAEVLERYRSLGARVRAIERVADGNEAIITDIVRNGDRLPGGGVVFAPVPDDEDEEEAIVFFGDWAALAVGDILVGTSEGLRVWWSAGPERLASEVQPFLARVAELPIERILVVHGPPVLAGGRQELQRALAAPPWSRTHS